MSNDALDIEIEMKRRRREELHTEIAELDIELKALERAATLRPSSGIERRHHGPQTRVARTSSRGGRQPGAISKPWREILRRVSANYPAGALAEDIAAYGPALDLKNLRPTDVRRQMEKYIDHGFVERAEGDRYKVTDLARERFNEALNDNAGYSLGFPLVEEEGSS